MAIKLITNNVDGAKIRIVGVGGGGGNIINNMVDAGINSVEFIAINTDKQVLDLNKANVKILIGKDVTKGLGAGMDAEKGMKAAENSRDEIHRALEGSDMVFITAGMGKGTGTGAAPVVARIAKSLDALVVALVTKPFGFEGNMKASIANDGIEKLKREVDSLIVIPNQKLIEITDDPNITKNEAFALVDRVLYHATKGISQIITEPGEMNVDMADVRTTMRGMGDALIGTGIASGPDRAEKATLAALNNPLLENIKIKGAKRVLTNISTNNSMKLHEFEKINSMIIAEVGIENESGFIIGTIDDPSMKEDELMITIIATGFDNEETNFGNHTQTKSEGKGIVELAAGKTKLKSNNVNPKREVALYDDEDEQNVQKYKIHEIPNDQDLKNLDVPAFKRRGDDLNLNEDFSENLKPIEEFDDNEWDDFNIDEDFQKPAFLRRQMD
ncbi:MAG TPA: cell division protein FtsZ [Bacteroidetes bacterium]|nr:cell division protein FtsZ [Ignavibacteria bacterium]HCA43884.1 cell division protein FtsZ [Bacteroidota bacterium]HCN36876.1 cell division protein FtsZ [Bacteroidota bacterium]